MYCAPTERRVSLLEARKTSDGTYPADPNAQPLSERATNSCPMSRSDPCRIFLSDRLLEGELVRGVETQVVPGYHFAVVSLDKRWDKH
jgi:hypothetical protein